MAEAESAFARLLKFFLAKVVFRSWGSLDQAAKGNIETLLAVVFGIGIFAFILFALPWRPLVGAVENPELARPRVRQLQVVTRPSISWSKRLSAFWFALGGEVQGGGLLGIIFLALAAFGSWPYNFYILTRIVVCFLFICLALMLHRHKMFAFEAAIAVWALAFNPVAPFRFTKDTWQILNIAALLTLVASLFAYAQTQINLESAKIRVVDEKASQSTVAAEPQNKLGSRTYKYCGSCAIRVGRSDMFCKRCGGSLD